MRSLFHKSTTILFMEGKTKAQRFGGIAGGAQKDTAELAGGPGLGVSGAHRLRSDQTPFSPHHGQEFHPIIPAMPWCFLDTKTECRKDVNINQEPSPAPSS